MTYITALTAEEACRALAEAGGTGRVIAGGTDLLLELDEGKKSASVLVDIMKIPALKSIALEGENLVIGAAATLTEIARSPLVQRYFPSLAKGAGSVGALQIRNVATLSGNVVTAQPAADGAMALAVLEPVFTIQGPEGVRYAKMPELYVGFGKSALDSTRELMTEIRIPLPKEGQAASFVRLELRKSLSLPMLNASAMVEVRDGTVVWARMAMGPVGVGPVRAAEAEAWLCGKPFTPENRKTAGALALKDANPRGNPLRGSIAYRMETLPVIMRRALDELALTLCPDEAKEAL